jgi:uncharacterized protein with von Willebrand factor type A (vWA) domain
VFTDFLYHLRGHGLKVSTTEWLSLVDALARGYSRADLAVFYRLARSLLVKKEAHYDLFDRAFASHFKGLDVGTEDIAAAVLEWLKDPVLPELSPEALEAMKAMDLDTLRSEFEARLREQDERHDGGNRWVGTGGTSPFGHGGVNPQGVRVGGAGGGRSAVQIAESRRFKNLRNDVVLDTRQIGVALRRLKKLAKHDSRVELDVDATIDKSAREGGDIDLVFSPVRENRVKLLLLVDVGGSMDPHALVCERLFSAAHKASHFKAKKTYFFHNCPYGRLYKDIAQHRGPNTADVLKEIDRTWTVIFVGDAWMSPFELTHDYGAISYFRHNKTTGLQWLKRFREKTEKIVWLNPEPTRIWHADSIRIIRSLFPMYELTVDGITEAVDYLRGAKTAEKQPEPSFLMRGPRWVI